MIKRILLQSERTPFATEAFLYGAAAALPASCNCDSIKRLAFFGRCDSASVKFKK